VLKHVNASHFLTENETSFYTVQIQRLWCSPLVRNVIVFKIEKQMLSKWNKTSFLDKKGVLFWPRGKICV